MIPPNLSLVHCCFVIKFMMIMALSVILVTVQVAVADSSVQYLYGFADVSLTNIYPQSVPVQGLPITQESTYLTIAVANKNPTKKVGVRWTTDSWNTFQDSFAFYAASDYNNGYERWQLRIDFGNQTSDPSKPPFEAQVAAFVSYNNGPRSWDPNNNYFVKQKADSINPLCIVTNGVNYDSGSGNIVFSGLIRAYPYNRNTDFNPNIVNVRWTTDNWKTIKDTPATLTQASNYTWAWSFPVGSKDVIPDNVIYVFRYDSSTGQKWLNNNGNNYVLKLAPDVIYLDGYGYLPPANPPKTFNGIDNLSTQIKSNIPLGPPIYALDGQSVSGNSVFISSNTLKDGTHSLTVQVPFLNTNIIAKSVTTSFTVKNSVQFINDWFPNRPDPSFGKSAWDAQLVNGKLYVLFQQYVAARYSAFGTTAAPEVIYRIPSTYSALEGSVLRIAVDPATGNVYLLTTWGNLYKFFADGTFDANFGGFGEHRLELDPDTFQGSLPVCFASDVIIVSSHLIVADVCNNRILNFDPATGNFISEANVTSPSLFSTDGQSLFIAQEIVNQGSYILQHDPSSLNPVANPVALTPINNNNIGNMGITGFFVASDKIFLSAAPNHLVRISNAKTGATLGEWYAGVYAPTGPVPGGFDSAQSVVALSDGTFAVLSVGWAGFERFNQNTL